MAYYNTNASQVNEEEIDLTPVSPIVTLNKRYSILAIDNNQTVLLHFHKIYYNFWYNLVLLNRLCCCQYYF